MDNRAPSMLKPTFIAGAIFGVLVAIPGISLLNNCTCCSLVAACGFVAAFLYSRDCKREGCEFGPGPGALVGLIAGAFYALVTSIVGSIVFVTIGDPVLRGVLEWAQQNPDMPPEALDGIDRALEDMSSKAMGFGKMVIGFFFSVLVGAIFSTLGGLIGGTVFKVQPPAAPPASQAPPPMAPPRPPVE